MKLPLSVTLLLCALAPGTATAQSCSTKPPPATVIVKSEMLPLEISEDRNFGELTRMFKKPGAHPAGLYTGAVAVMHSAQYRWAGNGREYCVSVDTVEVTLRLQEPKMYVGRELADDRCARQSVWEHEILHYRIDQDVLKRYIPIAERAVEYAARQAGGVSVSRESDIQRAGERMARSIRQSVERFARDMQSERDSLHERHDSREEYARTAAACADGNLGTSRPVLCATESRLCTDLQRP